jgi:proline iminopeptidase
MQAGDNRKTLYPEIEPYDTGRLKVSDLHELYYEQVGNPEGSPVVYLHGGPGDGIHKEFRQFHDPEVYRVVLFDQRGCGQSTPFAALEGNTTWDLVEDIERLREHLGIVNWQVYGGSWGSTLALAYAETYPERVTQLVLRGIFLGTQEEGDWLYKAGASAIFPDAWEQFISHIPVEERSNLVEAYYRRLTSDDAETRLQAATEWTRWEASVIFLVPRPDVVAEAIEGAHAEPLARVECHYFINGCFLKTENQLIEDIHRIRHIPAVIVQGRYDVVTPIKNAWKLHRAWPKADLKIVPTAGHASLDPDIVHELVSATDRFRS